MIHAATSQVLQIFWVYTVGSNIIFYLFSKYVSKVDMEKVRLMIASDIVTLVGFTVFCYVIF